MSKELTAFSLAVCQMILLVATGVVGQEVSLRKMAFGQACNATSKCEARDWLACNKGVCGCLKPDSMIYESPKKPTATLAASNLLEPVGKCVIKASERCSFSLGENEDGRPIFDTFPCVQNATCRPDGVCSCNPGFYEDLNGTCIKYQSHMQKCGPILKCQAEAGLQCTVGVCRCKTSPAIFNVRNNRCVGVPGNVCVNSTCAINSECRQGLCECKEGFYLSNKTKSCVAKSGFDGACLSDEQCRRDNRTGLELKCIDGKCACDPEVAVYGKVRDPYVPLSNPEDIQEYRRGAQLMCAPKAMQSCAQGFCAPNAYCLRHGDTSTYASTTTITGSPSDDVCVCSPGTTLSNLTGLCGSAYNADCYGPGECEDGLVCKGGKCKCRYEGQVYNTTVAKCTSPLGGPCSFNVDCFQNTKCIRFPFQSFGICQCNDGYVADRHGQKCHLGFNQRCSVESECGQQGLSCIESRCQCKRFSMYSKEFQSCVGLAGSHCNNFEHDCTANATCRDPSSRVINGISGAAGFFGLCKCDEGFTQTEEYTCSPEEQQDNDNILF